MLVLIAAALAAVQLPPIPPTPVALKITGEGIASDRAPLHRLLFQVWNPRGDMRAVVQRGKERWSSCVSRGPKVEIDTACVQRRIPRRRDGLPVVALFITRNTGVSRHLLHCISASGAGRAFVTSLVDIAQPGRMSRQKNNDRSAVARCINEAAPGSVTGSIW